MAMREADMENDWKAVRGRSVKIDEMRKKAKKDPRMTMSVLIQ